MLFPCVTVIMPVYNIGEKCVLDQSIRSILNQTFSDLELIICDDASTDDTPRYLQKWAADSRITVITNTVNQKAGAARNACIRKARGKYIALMDADDIATSERLEKQVAFLETHPEYGFVGCRMAYFQKYIGDSSGVYWLCEFPTPDDFLMTLPFAHATLLFRREVLETVGGYRTIPKVARSEDYDLLLRAYAAGFRGANLSSILYWYRVDRQTYCRRKYRYRFHEALVKWEGFSRLGLMPHGILYVVKPLVVGLIPQRILEPWKQKYYGRLK